MQKYFRLLALTFLSLFTAMAYASNPCELLSNTLSINQCKQTQLKQAQTKLAKYWQQALKQHSKPAEAKQALENEQKLWQKYADQHCQTVYQLYLPGTIAPSMMFDCQTRLTQSRTVEIWKAYIQTLSGDKPALPRP
ncbi:lysozyme inhibitor LprI family protein [Parashewanella tropica]|uniref:lysozyme inhibitor LprI family protein n=1 Tax=Parashewanella tropica TaxID=2547970 RepID=UPI00105AA4D2|nr:lysozyme inhibitor LprI family protein [Parashewanella tropica]